MMSCKKMSLPQREGEGEERSWRPLGRGWREGRVRGEELTMKRWRREITKCWRLREMRA